MDKIDDDLLKSGAMLYKLRRDIDDRIEPVLFEGNSDPSEFLEGDSFQPLTNGTLELRCFPQLINRPRESIATLGKHGCTLATKILCIDYSFASSLSTIRLKIALSSG
jgi:hypothetical protein